ncbi:hypothetical protein N7474_002365 [Penicillium riverlandense]|uniref:uncharacterized protein n=1 Tax=Penicillium riverlandense TaxID=1903569 RepID=UPI00254905F9|nr:uncharacterized protein N7474_002365 [Penicillium riverlandense]KAJ5825227.1 hypothetical protein N7474_002365 [Penicillium riverlandense]
MQELPGSRDVFGQLPRLKGYTHLALCFHYPDIKPRETVVESLQKACQRLTTALPWLAGRVVNRGTGAGCSGVFAICSCTKAEGILKVQDRSDVCPSYDDIIRSNGSSDMLDCSLLSAETTLPDSYEDESAPVLTLTGTWIKNGIILDCAAQHNMCDMGGIDQFLQLLATSLQNGELPQPAIEINNRDRRSIFPLLGQDEIQYDHSAMRCPSALNRPLRPPPPPGPRPAFQHFPFSATSLRSIAEMCNTPSIDDALSAFVWKRLSAVRLHLYNSPDAITGFSRAVDCRRILSVPAQYMGQLAVKTFSTMTLRQIEESSLETVAAHLRKDLQRIRDQNFLRSLATLIDSEPDKSTFNFVQGFNPDTWINASSWAGVNAYTLEFGLLGKPAVIRRPTSKPVQSLLYFLPQTEQGDIDVLLCLKYEETVRLKKDEEWSKYTLYIG